MDLALNNLQMLKCHKTQLTNRVIWLDSPCGVMDNVLDWNIVVSDFKRKSFYYVHFLSKTRKKGVKPLIPSNVLNSVIKILLQE